MQLKNYTSTVPAERTVMRIEEALAKAGATGIIKDYENGRVVALCFRVRLPDMTKDVTIRLPANEHAVYESMMKAKARPWNADKDKVKDQARRTAWRLMQDWCEVQLSLIQMHQVDFMQVFLPYAWDGHRTFYESLREGGFKMLPAPVEVEP